MPTPRHRSPDEDVDHSHYCALLKPLFMLIRSRRFYQTSPHPPNRVEWFSTFVIFKNRHIPADQVYFQKFNAKKMCKFGIATCAWPCALRFHFQKNQKVLKKEVCWENMQNAFFLHQRTIAKKEIFKKFKEDIPPCGLVNVIKHFWMILGLHPTFSCRVPVFCLQKSLHPMDPPHIFSFLLHPLFSEMTCDSLFRRYCYAIVNMSYTTAVKYSD